MQVCSSTAAVASGAVSHRFGEDAGRVTSSALCAVGSTVGAVHNVASLGRRGLVTNVTKCAATGVAKTVAADDAWEEWPARRPVPMLLSKWLLPSRMVWNTSELRLKWPNWTLTLSLLGCPSFGESA